jgi:16S rRNA pseudouridine516 synthase
MKLAQLLFSQGFGSRRDCDELIHGGTVEIGGIVVDDPAAVVDPVGLEFSVQGKPWTYHERAIVMLNKPAGYECSQKPKSWPSVLTLLPPPLRRRGLQPVGRLDQDTTGLLLLTDDGALIHRLTSPKRHVPKVYLADLAEPLTDRQIAQLLHGVVLNDDPKPVRAAAAEAVAERQLRLTLTEGKYHQVKRMVAAAGNHVAGLHRSQFGALALPVALAPGQWQWVADESVIFGTGTVPT